MELYAVSKSGRLSSINADKPWLRDTFTEKEITRLRKGHIVFVRKTGVRYLNLKRARKIGIVV